MHGNESDLGPGDPTSGPPGCRRPRGVSGRWTGTSGALVLGDRLDLRVDIDVRYSPDSPVLYRVSGDRSRLRPTGGPQPGLAATYLESWIIDAPAVTWQPCSVTVTGTVRYWTGTHPPTTATIVIGWQQGTFGTATATFTNPTGSTSYSLGYVDNAFRELELELDHGTSVDIEPRVPEYDTDSHPHRPADLSRRVLTIQSAYAEAGVAVTLSPGGGTLDDSDPTFTSWSPGELHDAMETAYSRWAGGWPAWRMWGLQAGRFDNAGVGGIMFDARAAYGGAGDAPERQGFAVFRNHSWFADLRPGPPTTQAQAWAMRHYLYTWVHEAGHAFNLLHSWDKSRPNSLSWMNYDWKYDQANGTDAFWSRFRFRFDDEELLHLRHGNRAAVIMGADPWSAGGHLDAPPELTSPERDTGVVELTVRAEPFVDFLSPVKVELRLKNLAPVPVLVDGRLDPVAGTSTVQVRTPSGHVITGDPIMCQVGLSEEVVLSPAGTPDGSDRISRLVDLTYGKGGFLFAEPGDYEIRAVYESFGQVAVSGITRVRVGRPADRAQDAFAADWFTPKVGLTLALDGSMSPHLTGAVDVLTEAADRYADSAAGVGAARTLARCVGRDFFRRAVTGNGVDAMVRHHTADPAAALAATGPALTALAGSDRKSANLAQHDLVDLRAAFHLEQGDPATAAAELSDLAADLTRRGANPVVVDAVTEESAALAPAKPRARRRR